MKTFVQYITEVEEPTFRMPREKILANMEKLNKHQKASLHRKYQGRSVTHLSVKPMGGLYHHVVVHFDDKVQHEFLIGKRGGISKSGVKIMSLRNQN
jgi:hypothetical protein